MVAVAGSATVSSMGSPDNLLSGCRDRKLRLRHRKRFPSQEGKTACHVSILFRLLLLPLLKRRNLVLQ